MRPNERVHLKLFFIFENSRPTQITELVTLPKIQIILLAMHLTFWAKMDRNFCLQKIFNMGWYKMASLWNEVSTFDVRYIGLDLSITRSSWSRLEWPMCTSNCYCPIYCNPFTMSSTGGAHLCTLDWLGAKENCDCSSLASFCKSIVLLQLLPVPFEFS